VSCDCALIVALRMAISACILCALMPIGLAQGVTIHVRVYDGRTGKNLSGMNLELIDYHSEQVHSAGDDLNGRTPVRTSPHGESYTASTDPQGVLVFAGLGRDGYWTPCSKQKFYIGNERKYGSEYLYPVSTISTSGLVAANSCSKKTATAIPGELIIFVRPSTWWERFVAGMRS
jgi:hypothetical protein